MSRAQTDAILRNPLTTLQPYGIFQVYGTGREVPRGISGIVANAINDRSFFLR